MVHGHHRHLSAGSLRRSGSGSNRKSNGSDGKGVFSKVLGSIRRRSHEKQEEKEQEKEEEETHAPAWKQRQDWIAKYECTHHPDRPRVDKRTQEVLTDVEYAAKLQRLQERSERYHGLSHQRSNTPPRINTNIPNFSYSSKSPKGNRESPPGLNKTGWPPSGHKSPTDHDSGERDPISPVSPGAMTIQVYRASAMDRGPIIRHSSESKSNQGPLLPRKAYNPNESHKKLVSRGSSSSHKRGGTSTDSRAPVQINRGLGITIYSDLDSSSAQTTTTNNSSRRPSASLASPQKCPWPDCGAVLTTAQEKKDNLCASCHSALYPRESAFFGPSSDPAAATDADLRALEALIGARVDTAEDRGQLVDRAPVAYEFKLQPAPRGKRRRRLPGAEHRNRSERRLSHVSRRMSVVSPLSVNRSRQRRRSSNSSNVVQDTRSFTERKTSQTDANTHTNNNTDSSKGKDKDSHNLFGYWGSSSGSGDSEYHSFHTRSPSRSHSPSPSDASWTTDTRSTCSSSDEEEASASPGNRDKHAADDFLHFVPPNTAERNSRDSALYQEIEDIIDSYTQDGGKSATENEQRKADVVASYYAKEPTAVRMRREGFF
ncbi:hypothetical protein GGS26DRAFT_597431 [Hypomontagnella submonticulosa]|nr:hypothetical protein GGS26DRAFT_597431 [Hypomontagnella submonticulosa]